MSNRIGTSLVNCYQCLYASVCEYGLTHHPNEMCREGMELYQANNTRGNRVFIHTADDFSGIKHEEIKAVTIRLEGRDTYYNDSNK